LSVEERVPSQAGEFPAQFKEPFHKGPQKNRLGIIIPGDPTDLVVLAVAIVVSALGAEALIPAEEEGNTPGTDQGGEEIADLAAT